MLAALLLGLSFVLLPLVTPSALAPGAAPADAVRSLYLPSPGARGWSGAVLFAACGAYCIGLWSGGRRTLPMKTWRLALATATGHTVAPRRAAWRFVAWWIGPALALAGYMALQPLGLGRWALPLLAVNYAWALVDRERQFLHDRVAGTRLIVPAAA
jgi:hypothetical protein